MHSSTSNSEHHIVERYAPVAPYKKIWGVAIISWLVLLILFETLTRLWGHLPSVTDDMFLWAYERSKVYDTPNQKGLVLVGSSRIQVGVDPYLLEQYLPSYKVIQLAIDGHNGYATLRDLVNDPKFTGVVVFDTTEKAFFPDNENAQKPWVDYFKKEWSSLSRIEKIINSQTQVFLQSKLLLVNSHLNIRNFIFNPIMIQPAYYYMRADRYRPAFYYDRMTLEQLEKHRERRLEIINERMTMSTTEQEQKFEEILRTKIKGLVENQRKKGGDIIFLRMPTCDEHWEFDQNRYPKDKYWDKIQPITGARVIHFLDIPSLSNFDCPDTSHLDARDAPVFTEHLAVEVGRILADKGISKKNTSPLQP